MVKSNYKIIAFLTFFLTALYPAQARTVSHLNIEKTGLLYEGHNEESEKTACKLFRPEQNQLVRFFSLASESKESGTLLHEYYSPCFAVGTVVFDDGSSGRWNLQSSGLGFVFFNTGEQAVFFHRDNQWTDPYLCTYGLSDEPEPGCE